MHTFRGCISPRPSGLCAYASAVALPRPAARLTTDLPGSALIGQDSHLLDDKPKFRRSPPDLLLSDQHCLVALAKVAKKKGACQAWHRLRNYPRTAFDPTETREKQGVRAVLG